MISSSSAQMGMYTRDNMCRANTGMSNSYQNEKSFPYQLCGEFTSSLSLYMIKFDNESFLKDSLSKCLNLQSIQIIGGVIPNIPARIAQFNSKVSHLALLNTNIVKIDRSALVGLLNLQSLYMPFNNIECLPYDLFQNTPNLRDINFDCNRITSLDKNIFKNLQYLEKASFNGNFITTLPLFDLSTTSINPMITSMIFIFNVNPIMSINPSICDLFKPTTKPYSVIKMQMVGIPCQNVGYITDVDNYSCGQPGLLQTCFNNWKTSAYAPIRCL